MSASDDSPNPEVFNWSSETVVGTNFANIHNANLHMFGI